MPVTGKIQLTEGKETLFITLYAKAVDCRAKRSILHDRKADEIFKTIDGDFTKYKGFGNIVTVVRARHFDEWIKEFIAENADAVVLYLGCGLDTRITRISPAAGVNWFDVDYPDVIGLRKTFYADRAGYKMIGSAVTDPRWFEEIPCDRPTVIVAEGILEYIAADDVKILLNRITDYFPHGDMMFDVMSSVAIKAGQEKLKDTTGAVLKWAVDSIAQVDDLNPALKIVQALSPFRSRFARGLSPRERLFYGFVSLFPKYRNMLRILLYRF